MINEILNKIDIQNSNLTKKVSLRECVGEILATDLVSKKDLPCFDNAALDGYAFDYDEVGLNLKVAGTIFAGDKKKYTLNKGECFRIMTGAIMPNGANTVVRLEDAKFQNELLMTDKNIKKFNAFRLKGEEIKSGEILLKSGEILTPAKVMLLASQGISEILVFKKPKVIIFSSGDELKEPWQEADDSEIYNANSSAIMAILNEFDCKYGGIIPDDLEKTQNLIENSNKFDVIITSGGASVGDKDYMHEALQKLGFKQIFDHIDIKPGRPTKCYKKDEKIVFVLPGNPSAAFLLCFLVVLPTLKKLSGQKENFFRKIKTKMSGDLKLKSGRMNIVLGKFEDEVFKATNLGVLGSGAIMPLVNSNALYISKNNEDMLKDTQELEIFMLI
ncbi:molybdopterin molybdotransferase MoeA [Campylobacter sp. FMV-PI01]|uniref:Molybdopterin molybdenumtransferase n=1 Tax=Campylobacter portucalensis TaxID=2608384 RepID=A0A6L5WI79_9BACT|nr:molybdopterin molybdotransferase MoeA [Campylobacter portucalensis]MSN96829.1 molybdopterin molybdotransferase MoeA [Campylobacter portucalensis]